MRGGGGIARRTGSTQGWRKSEKTCHFFSDGAPSRTGFADVRPCLPDQRTPLERNEPEGSVKTRRSELVAVKQEVVRRGQLWHHRRSSPPLMRQSNHRSRDLRASSAPFIVAAFEAIQVNSPAHPSTHFNHFSCTCRKALRTRSRCTLQLSKASSLCVLRLLATAYHRTRPVAATGGRGSSQEKRRRLRSPIASCTAGCG